MVARSSQLASQERTATAYCFPQRSPKAQQRAFAGFAGRCAVDGFQVLDEGFAVFPADVFQALTDLVNDAALDGGLREDGLNRLLEAGKTVDAGDEDVLDPARLQVADHAQPEVRTLAAVAQPVTEHVALSLEVDAQHDIDRVLTTFPSRRSFRCSASR